MKEPNFVYERAKLRLWKTRTMVMKTSSMKNMNFVCGMGWTASSTEKTNFVYKTSFRKNNFVYEKYNFSLRKINFVYEKHMLCLRKTYTSSTKIMNFVYEIPNFVYEIPNFAHEIPNFVYEIPNFVYEIPNFVYEIPNFVYENSFIYKEIWTSFLKI